MFIVWGGARPANPRVPIHRDDLNAESLQLDDHFLAQFTRAQEHRRRGDAVPAVHKAGAGNGAGVAGLGLSRSRRRPSSAGRDGVAAAPRAHRRTRAQLG